MFQIYKLKNLNNMKIIIFRTKKYNICQLNLSKIYISKSNILDFKTSMPSLTKKQHETLFEGEFPRTPKGCTLDKAKHHWKPWLKFVNDYLVLHL